MKKILFAAVIFAGTTLGFAKDNVKKTEVEVTKTEVVKKGQQTKVKDQNVDLQKKLRFCFDNWIWTTTERDYDMAGNVIGEYEVTHMATFTYLCGENDPRNTTIYGNPGL